MHDQLANLSPVTVVGFIMRSLSGGISMQPFTGADERAVRWATTMGAKHGFAFLRMRWVIRNRTPHGHARLSMVAEEMK
jgi:hypothetical protein